jgi:dTDP-6-deoxy-L-talose 4-dehydrogenase (NAD+)
LEKFATEIFIHAAWNVNPADWRETPSQQEFILSSNILINYLAEAGLKKIVGVGTCLEYIASSNELNEDSQISHDFDYLKDKHEMRHNIFKIANNFSISASWSRVFNMYGSGDNVKRLIPRLIEHKKNNTSAILHNPDLPISYINVDDAAKALIQISKVMEPFNSVFNVSSKDLTTPRKLQEAIDKNNFNDIYLNLDKDKETNFLCYRGDNSKLVKIGWKKETDFDLEIKRIVNG